MQTRLEKVVNFIKNNSADFDAVEILTAKRNGDGQLEVTTTVTYGTGASGYYSGYGLIFEDMPVEVTVKTDIRRDRSGLGNGYAKFIGIDPLPRYRWNDDKEVHEVLIDGQWVLDLAVQEPLDTLEVFLITRGFNGGYTLPNQPYLRAAVVVCHERDEHEVWDKIRKAFHGRGWLVVSPAKSSHTIVNLDSWWATTRSMAPVEERELVLISNSVKNLEQEKKDFLALMLKLREEGNEAVENLPEEFWDRIGGRPRTQAESEAETLKFLAELSASEGELPDEDILSSLIK